ncbi:hypothetical protein [Vibrio phage vB_VhaP_PG11]|nr:hypothetical protein [Vibrio phage vB_VhaP_PG11]
MTDLQKLGALVALLVGVIGIGSSGWAAAKFFISMDNSVKATEKSISVAQEILDRHDKTLTASVLRIDQLENGALIYVYDNEALLVVRNPKGKMLRIPLESESQQTTVN